MVKRSEITKKHQEFVDALKFTPTTVRLYIQGYGGECYAGKVDRKIYDYFKEHKYDISEYANDWDSNFGELIPSEMQPFYPGSPYDCDNLFHASGAELSDLNEIRVEEVDSGKELWVHNCGYSDLDDTGIEVEEGGGAEIYEHLDENTVVFWGGQGEKGCFFDGEFVIRAPFDPKKLKIVYENCDDWYIISTVLYDGEEIDGSGGYSTTGKWAEQKWVLFGDEEVYEPVSIEDRESEDSEEWDPAEELDKIVEEHSDDFLQEAADALNETFADELSTSDKTPEEIMYGLTDWFDRDTKPTRKGEYEVLIDAPWPNGGLGRAEWSGRTWKKDGEKVKIHQWRGLAREPYEA